MTQIAFDTLAYTKMLIEAGMDNRIAEAQAEAQARILGGLMQDKLVTKEGLKETTTELGERLVDKIDEVDKRLSGKIDFLDKKFVALQADFGKLRSEFKVLESKMTVKLGSIMVLGLGTMTMILKLFHL